MNIIFQKAMLQSVAFLFHIGKVITLICIC